MKHLAALEVKGDAMVLTMLLHLLRSSWRARLEPSRSSPRILRAGRMLQRRPPNFKAIGQHCIADAAPCPAAWQPAVEARSLEATESPSGAPNAAVICQPA